MSTEDLSSTLGVHFEGIDDANRYAETMKRVARAEKDVAAAVQARQAAMKLGGGTLPTVEKALDRMNVATEGSPRRSARGTTTPWERTLRSTRIGVGKSAPLAGQAMEAMMGKEAAGAVFGAASKLAGPIGAALAALEVVKRCGEEMNKLATASARASSEITSDRAMSGGSTYDVARLKGLEAFGFSAQSAAAFKDRIASDPQAKMEASRFGVYNMKNNYGDPNWAKQYLTTIDGLSKIQDEAERLRRSRNLGLESEVSRYSLLSPETRSQMMRSASTTAGVNDIGAQRQAAEFEVAQAREAQARANAMTGLGQLWTKDITAMNNLAARAEEFVAQSKAARDAMDFGMKAVSPLYGAFRNTGGAAQEIDGGKPANSILGNWFRSLGMSNEKPSDPAEQLGLNPVNAQNSAIVASNARLEHALNMLAGRIEGLGVRGRQFTDDMKFVAESGVPGQSWRDGSMAWGAV